MKFKVGDKVRISAKSKSSWLKVGEIVSVERVNPRNEKFSYVVQDQYGEWHYLCEEDIEPIEPVAKMTTGDYFRSMNDEGFADLLAMVATFSASAALGINPDDAKETEAEYREKFLSVIKAEYVPENKEE